MQKEVWKGFQEREADRELARREMQELRDSQKETEKQLRKTDSQFNTKWGKLVEALVEGKLVEILRKRNIEVRRTSNMIKVSYQREGGEIQEKEFDIEALNGSEIVLVEVKTTLTPKDVSHFLKAMEYFNLYFPSHSGKKAYGAVAFLREESHAALRPERKGLFVIRAAGDSASIINRPGFQPKVFPSSKKAV